MISRTRGSAPPLINIKRGQIHLSFGMIFSIILIIIFIAFAFYAIQKFLGLQDSIKMNTFYDTLQNDVNTVWNSAQAIQTKSYILPSSVKEICFTNTGSENMILYGSNNRPENSHNVANVNITATTVTGDSCYNVVNGQLSLVLQKNFGDTLVTIAK
jgi:uncharacterized protein (UPF0333 family)